MDISDQTGGKRELTKKLIDFYIKSYIEYQIDNNEEGLEWQEFQKYCKSLSDGAAPFEYIDNQSTQGQNYFNKIQ